MSRSATERLGDALIHIDKAIEYAARDAMFGDAWPDMWGMRNRIAHTYSTVQPDVVMATVKHDLPGIRSRIADELAKRESAR